MGCIDRDVHGFSKMLISCIMSVANELGMIKQSQCPGNVTRKPWMDNECKLAKNESHRL